MAFMELDRESLTIDLDVLPRLSDNQAVIKQYADIQRVQDMPPPVVFHDEENGCYWLADGLYRIKGWQVSAENGDPILCEVRKGSKRDAMWHASGANARHGCPLTQRERAVALEHAITAADGKKSDSEIGELVGVSAARVCQVRQNLEREGRVAAKTERDGRRRTDGTVSVVPLTKKGGRKPASGQSRGRPYRPVNRSAERQRRNVMRDDANVEVPDFLQPLGSQTRELQALETRLNDVFADAVRLGRMEVGRRLDLKKLLQWIREAQRTIDDALLLFTCRDCVARGSTTSDCACGGIGWMTRERYNTTYRG